MAGFTIEEWQELWLNREISILGNDMPNGCSFEVIGGPVWDCTETDLPPNFDETVEEKTDNRGCKIKTTRWKHNRIIECSFSIKIKITGPRFSIVTSVTRNIPPLIVTIENQKVEITCPPGAEDIQLVSGENILLSWACAGKCTFVKENIIESKGKFESANQLSDFILQLIEEKKTNV